MEPNRPQFKTGIKQNFEDSAEVFSPERPSLTQNMGLLSSSGDRMNESLRLNK